MMLDEDKPMFTERFSSASGFVRRAFAMAASSTLLLGFLVALPGHSQAALITCDASFTTDGTAKVHDGNNELGNLTAASDCQYLDPTPADFAPNLTNVNNTAFFGTNTWMDNGQTTVNANA